MLRKKSLGKSTYVEILDGDQTELTDESSRQLVGMVAPEVPNALMVTGQKKSRLLPPMRALLATADPPVGKAQLPQRRSVGARAGNLLPGGEGGKVLDAEIEPTAGRPAAATCGDWDSWSEKQTYQRPATRRTITVRTSADPGSVRCHFTLTWPMPWRARRPSRKPQPESQVRLS